MKSSINSVQKRRRKHIFVSILFSILIFTITVVLTNYTINLDEKTIVSTNLPREFHDMKVVFASDFNYDGNNSTLILNAIHKINSQRADLVVLGGNYGTNFQNSLKFFDVIHNIHSRFGVVAVIGENDLDKDKKNEFLLANKMKSRNIRLLINDYANFKQGDQYISIYGIDDIISGNPDYEKIKFNNDNFTIFVSNSWKALNKMITNDDTSISNYIDLSLMGSTLGGQYIFRDKIQKLLSPYTSPYYFNGWHNDKKNNILVSNGIGVNNGFRFFVMPQVHSINIKYR